MFVAYGLSDSWKMGAGKDYNCNSAICYGIGPPHDDLLKQLQVLINGFIETPITDAAGQIGANTARAAAQAAKFAWDNNWSDNALIYALSSGATKEWLTGNAPELFAEFRIALQRSVDSAWPSPTPSPKVNPVTGLKYQPKNYAVQVQPSPTSSTAPTSSTPGSGVQPGARPGNVPSGSFPDSTPFYKNWKFLVPVAAVVVIGGGFFLFRRTPMPPPAALARRRQRKK